MLGRCIDLGNPVSDHPLNRGLLGWWMALPNNQGGSRLFDLCRRNPGTLVSGMSWVVAPDGGALQSLDLGQRVDLASTLAISTAFSAAFRFNRYLASGTNSLMGGSTGNHRIAIANTSDYFIRFHSDGLTPAAAGYAGVNTWQTLVVTYRSGGECAAFCNGVKTVLTATGDSGSSTYARLFDDGGNQRFHGAIRSAAAWGRALSDSEAWLWYDQSVRGYPDALRYFTPTAWSFASSAAPAGMVHPRRSRRAGTLLRM